MKVKMKNLEIDKNGFVQVKEKCKSFCYEDNNIRFCKLEPWYEKELERRFSGRRIRCEYKE